VVSEETGNISICFRGRIERGLKPGQFEKRLSELLLLENIEEEEEEEEAEKKKLPEAETTN
jgi:hypothetical protein